MRSYSYIYPPPSNGGKRRFIILVVTGILAGGVDSNHTYVPTFWTNHSSQVEVWRWPSSLRCFCRVYLVSPLVSCSSYWAFRRFLIWISLLQMWWSMESIWHRWLVGEEFISANIGQIHKKKEMMETYTLRHWFKGNLGHIKICPINCFHLAALDVFAATTKTLYEKVRKANAPPFRLVECNLAHDAEELEAWNIDEYCIFVLRRFWVTFFLPLCFLLIVVFFGLKSRHGYVVSCMLGM